MNLPNPFPNGSTPPAGPPGPIPDVSPPPPVNAPGAVQTYSVVIDGVKVCLTGSEVSERWRSGQLNAETSLWRAGWEDWKKLGSVRDEFGLPGPAKDSASGLGRGRAWRGLVVGFLGIATALYFAFAYDISGPATAEKLQNRELGVHAGLVLILVGTLDWLWGGSRRKEK